MTKQILKRLCVGLLLAVCFTFVFPHNVKAVGVENADQEMASFCDSWDKNMQDYSDQEHCWSCQIFMLLFDSSNTLAGQINQNLSGPASGVVIMGGALWLVFYTLIFFSSVGSPPDPMEYLTHVGKIMLRVGFGCAFLAGGATMAFEYAVNPVLDSGARLANVALEASGGMVNATMPQDIGGSISGPMGGGVRSAMKEMIYQMAAGMAKAQSIAQGLRCGSIFWRKFEGIMGIPSFPIFNPLMWVVGSWLGCVFWVVSILFCFAMMDVIFRIGLLVSMLPVFVAAWVFPKTGGFAKSAWDMLLNSVLVFFITGITASFIVILVEKSWDAGTSGMNGDFMGKMQQSAYVEAWDMLFDSPKGLVAVLLVCFVSFWALGMAPKSDGLAKKFVGGAFSSCIAIAAIKALINFIINVILTIITIITFSLSAGIQALHNMVKLAQRIQKIMKNVEKIQKMQKRIEKMQKRIQQMQKKLDKVRKVAKKAKAVQGHAQKAMNLVPNGD